LGVLGKEKNGVCGHPHPLEGKNQNDLTNGTKRTSAWRDVSTVFAGDSNSRKRGKLAFAKARANVEKSIDL